MDSSSDEQSSAEDIAPSSAYNYYNYDADYSSDEDGYLIATSAKAKRRKAAKEKVKASILRAEALASSSSSSRNSIAQTSSTKQQISDADISSLRDKRKRD